jgi:hypothetical protein
MGIRLDKPWTELTAANIDPLPAQLGVYQLADPDDGERIIKIGKADARCNFGMRTALTDEIAAHPGRRLLFRFEVNQQYTTRYDELLMVHVHDHGTVPEENVAENRDIGRLSPG